MRQPARAWPRTLLAGCVMALLPGTAARAEADGAIAHAASAARGAASPAHGEVQVTITGLRNGKGMLRACITTQPRSFPDCKGAVRTLSVAAINGAVLTFGNLPSGRYAISILHDENGDGRMNKRLILPKEGYGFSRNAPVRFGPPSFEQAAIDVGQAPLKAAIRVRYM